MTTIRVCSLNKSVKECDIAKIFGCIHCGDYKTVYRGRKRILKGE